MSKQPTPERTEVVSILMVLEPSTYERHEEAVRTLEPSFQNEHFQKGELVNVTYRLSIHYYNVVKELQAVAEICDDPEVITAISCSELEASRLVIYETLKKLDNVIQQVKDRK